jgi:hypothetical protein
MQAGALQLWAVDRLPGAEGDPAPPAAASRPLQQLTLAGDAVTRAAALPREPYLLLGCASGAVAVALMVGGSGAPAAAGRQVRGLKLLSYESESTG